VDSATPGLLGDLTGGETGDSQSVEVVDDAARIDT
jgi:hypothetical protein